MNGRLFRVRNRLPRDLGPLDVSRLAAVAVCGAVGQSDEARNRASKIVRALRAVVRVALPAAVLLVISSEARAAELVMFRSPLCEWCTVWEAEVGTIYAKTPEGRAAPLRRVDIDALRPTDLSHIRPVIYTPTFVLVDGGREIGRIIGYPGADHFWALLDALLKRAAPPHDAPKMPSGSYV
jgi:protein-disulfide isomerase